MSLRIDWSVTIAAGTPAESITVELCDPTGAWGVRRKDTQEVVIPAETALISYSLGHGLGFYHVFDEPENLLEYEYYLKITDTTSFTNVYYVHGSISGTYSELMQGTLGYVRRLLVDVSGRYDLAVDPANGNYADAGLANMYINEAQRWLDRRLPHHKTMAKLYKTVPANTEMITFNQARSVSGVFEAFSDGTHQLLNWSSLIVGLAPDQIDESLGNLPYTANVIAGDAHWPKHAVWIAPSDKERVVCVLANWYCPKLIEDHDRSYWTVQHPLLLAHTAMELIEIGHRNTQGVNDFRGPILDDLQTIYHDLVEEESAGPHWKWRQQ